MSDSQEEKADDPAIIVGDMHNPEVFQSTLGRIWISCVVYPSQDEGEEEIIPFTIPNKCRFCDLITEAVDEFFSGRADHPAAEIMNGLHKALRIIAASSQSFEPSDERLCNLCEKIYRYCVELLFDSAWMDVEDEIRASATREFYVFYCSLIGWSQDRFLVLAILSHKPWGHEIMNQVLSGDENMDKPEVDRYLKLEGTYLLEHRLRILIRQGLFYHAINLARACTEHPDLAEDLVFQETLYLLYFNLDLHQELQTSIEEHPDTEDIIEIARSLSSYCPHHASTLCRLIVQRIWSEAHTNYDLVTEAIELWMDISLKICSADSQLFAEGLQDLAALTDDSLHLYYLADVVYKKVGVKAASQIVSICLKALVKPSLLITDDIIQASKIDYGNAAICLLLSKVLKDDIRMQRLCLLSAFFITPSQESLASLEDCYRQNKQFQKPSLSSFEQHDLIECLMYYIPVCLSLSEDWTNLSSTCERYLRKSKVVCVTLKLPCGSIKTVQFHDKSWHPCKEAHKPLGMFKVKEAFFTAQRIYRGLIIASCRLEHQIQSKSKKKTVCSIAQEKPLECPKSVENLVDDEGSPDWLPCAVLDLDQKILTSQQFIDSASSKGSNDAQIVRRSPVSQTSKLVPEKLEGSVESRVSVSEDVNTVEQGKTEKIRLQLQERAENKSDAEQERTENENMKQQEGTEVINQVKEGSSVLHQKKKSIVDENNSASEQESLLQTQTCVNERTKDPPTPSAHLNKKKVGTECANSCMKKGQTSHDITDDSRKLTTHTDTETSDYCPLSDSSDTETISWKDEKDSSSDESEIGCKFPFNKEELEFLKKNDIMSWKGEKDSSCNESENESKFPFDRDELDFLKNVCLETGTAKESETIVLNNSQRDSLQDDKFVSHLQELENLTLDRKTEAPCSVPHKFTDSELHTSAEIESVPRSVSPDVLRIILKKDKQAEELLMRLNSQDSEGYISEDEMHDLDEFSHRNGTLHLKTSECSVRLTCFMKHRAKRQKPKNLELWRFLVREIDKVKAEDSLWITGNVHIDVKSPEADEKSASRDHQRNPRKDMLNSQDRNGLSSACSEDTVIWIDSDTPEEQHNSDVELDRTEQYVCEAESKASHNTLRNVTRKNLFEVFGNSDIPLLLDCYEEEFNAGIQKLHLETKCRRGQVNDSEMPDLDPCYGPEQLHDSKIPDLDPICGPEQLHDGKVPDLYPSCGHEQLHDMEAVDVNVSNEQQQLHDVNIINEQDKLDDSEMHDTTIDHGQEQLHERKMPDLDPWCGQERIYVCENLDTDVNGVVVNRMKQLDSNKMPELDHFSEQEQHVLQMNFSNEQNNDSKLFAVGVNNGQEQPQHNVMPDLDPCSEQEQLNDSKMLTMKVDYGEEHLDRNTLLNGINSKGEELFRDIELLNVNVGHGQEQLIDSSLTNVNVSNGQEQLHDLDLNNGQDQPKDSQNRLVNVTIGQKRPNENGLPDVHVSGCHDQLNGSKQLDVNDSDEPDQFDDCKLLEVNVNKEQEQHSKLPDVDFISGQEQCIDSRSLDANLDKENKELCDVDRSSVQEQFHDSVGADVNVRNKQEQLRDSRTPVVYVSIGQEHPHEKKLHYVNVSSDQEELPDLNVPSDQKQAPDSNDQEQLPDLNVPSDQKQAPDRNVSNDQEQLPGLNARCDQEQLPDINVINDSEQLPVVNVSNYPEQLADVSVLSDQEQAPDMNVSNDQERLPGVNVSNDPEQLPGVIVRYDQEQLPDVNVSNDPEQVPGVIVRYDQEQLPDMNVSNDPEQLPGVIVRYDQEQLPDVNVSNDPEQVPGVIVKYDQERLPDVNVSNDIEQLPGVNVRYEQEHLTDLNFDNNQVQSPCLNTSNDPEELPDVNVSNNHEQLPDVNVSYEQEHLTDLNVDNNQEQHPCLNTSNDLEELTDVNVSNDQEELPDVNVSNNQEQLAEENVCSDQGQVPNDGISSGQEQLIDSNTLGLNDSKGGEEPCYSNTLNMNAQSGKDQVSDRRILDMNISVEQEEDHDSKILHVHTKHQQEQIHFSKFNDVDIDSIQGQIHDQISDLDDRGKQEQVHDSKVHDVDVAVDKDLSPDVDISCGQQQMHVDEILGVNIGMKQKQALEDKTLNGEVRGEQKLIHDKQIVDIDAACDEKEICESRMLGVENSCERDDIFSLKPKNVRGHWSDSSEEFVNQEISDQLENQFAPGNQCRNYFKSLIIPQEECYLPKESSHAKVSAASVNVLCNLDRSVKRIERDSGQVTCDTGITLGTQDQQNDFQWFDKGLDKKGHGDKNIPVEIQNTCQIIVTESHGNDSAEASNIQIISSGLDDGNTEVELEIKQNHFSNSNRTEDSSEKGANSPGMAGQPLHQVQDVEGSDDLPARLKDSIHSADPVDLRVQMEVQNPIHQSELQSYPLLEDVEKESLVLTQERGIKDVPVTRNEENGNKSTSKDDCPLSSLMTNSAQSIDNSDTPILMDRSETVEIGNKIEKNTRHEVSWCSDLISIIDGQELSRKDGIDHLSVISNEGNIEKEPPLHSKRKCDVAQPKGIYKKTSVSSISLSCKMERRSVKENSTDAPKEWRYLSQGAEGITFSESSSCEGDNKDLNSLDIASYNKVLKNGIGEGDKIVPNSRLRECQENDLTYTSSDLRIPWFDDQIDPQKQREENKHSVMPKENGTLPKHVTGNIQISSSSSSTPDSRRDSKIKVSKAVLDTSKIHCASKDDFGNLMMLANCTRLHQEKLLEQVQVDGKVWQADCVAVEHNTNEPVKQRYSKGERGDSEKPILTKEVEVNTQSMSSVLDNAATPVPTDSTVKIATMEVQSDHGGNNILISSKGDDACLEKAIDVGNDMAATCVMSKKLGIEIEDSNHGKITVSSKLEACDVQEKDRHLKTSVSCDRIVCSMDKRSAMENQISSGAEWKLNYSKAEGTAQSCRSGVVDVDLHLQDSKSCSSLPSHISHTEETNIIGWKMNSELDVCEGQQRSKSDFCNELRIPWIDKMVTAEEQQGIEGQSVQSIVSQETEMNNEDVQDFGLEDKQIISEISSNQRFSDDRFSLHDSSKRDNIYSILMKEGLISKESNNQEAEIVDGNLSDQPKENSPEARTTVSQRVGLEQAKLNAMVRKITVDKAVQPTAGKLNATLKKGVKGEQERLNTTVNDRDTDETARLNTASKKEETIEPARLSTTSKEAVDPVKLNDTVTEGVEPTKLNTRVKEGADPARLNSTVKEGATVEPTKLNTTMKEGFEPTEFITKVKEGVEPTKFSTIVKEGVEPTKFNTTVKEGVEPTKLNPRAKEGAADEAAKLNTTVKEEEKVEPARLNTTVNESLEPAPLNTSLQEGVEPAKFNTTVKEGVEPTKLNPRAKEGAADEPAKLNTTVKEEEKVEPARLNTTVKESLEPAPLNTSLQEGVEPAKLNTKVKEGVEPTKLNTRVKEGVDPTKVNNPLKEGDTVEPAQSNTTISKSEETDNVKRPQNSPLKKTYINSFKSFLDSKSEPICSSFRKRNALYGVTYSKASFKQSSKSAAATDQPKKQSTVKRPASGKSGAESTQGKVPKMRSSRTTRKSKSLVSCAKSSPSQLPGDGVQTSNEPLSVQRFASRYSDEESPSQPESRSCLEHTASKVISEKPPNTFQGQFERISLQNFNSQKTAEQHALKRPSVTKSCTCKEQTLPPLESKPSGAAYVKRSSRVSVKSSCKCCSEASSQPKLMKLSSNGASGAKMQKSQESSRSSTMQGAVTRNKNKSERKKREK